MGERKRSPRPRRQATKVETKLADRRLRAGLTQAEMAELTGISLAHYRRLERGQMRNPPLRFLVNCALVLQAELLDIVEDEWLTWMPFDQRHPEPPTSATPSRRLCRGAARANRNTPRDTNTCSMAVLELPSDLIGNSPAFSPRLRR